MIPVETHSVSPARPKLAAGHTKEMPGQPDAFGDVLKSEAMRDQDPLPETTGQLPVPESMDEQSGGAGPFAAAEDGGEEMVPATDSETRSEPMPEIARAHRETVERPEFAPVPVESKPVGTGRHSVEWPEGRGHAMRPDQNGGTVGAGSHAGAMSGRMEPQLESNAGPAGMPVDRLARLVDPAPLVSATSVHSPSERPSSVPILAKTTPWSVAEQLEARRSGRPLDVPDLSRVPEITPKSPDVTAGMNRQAASSAIISGIGVGAVPGATTAPFPFAAAMPGPDFGSTGDGSLSLLGDAVPVSGGDRAATGASAAAMAGTITRATPAQIAHQIAVGVSVAQGGQTELRLNPEELGRVRLSLSGSEGGLVVAIAAERPETADLLRRHIDSLAREFEALGYADVDFRFEGESQQDRGHETARGGFVPRSDLPDDTDMPQVAEGLALGAGLDLKL
ncbi:hypothetical protein DFK10_08725 [Salibaculum griseiflavum]|uniref:Flagellar hook-length control protein-like C-terminal domain-containing protein n=2 Tax=Salibaculum griseiflavum TaxID=1914409 RepID=A0A2V1P5J7_9RHOB|nr:hypothetical protein DFK10_08725 [Salibaculum griseiflavum]